MEKLEWGGTFHPVGWWHEPGELRFYAPRDPDHVSYSLLNIQDTDEVITVPVDSIKNLARSIGISSLSILKMDIEGAEFVVLKSLLRDGPESRVICVEFDQPDATIRKTLKMVRLLGTRGYQLLNIESWNYTFEKLPPICEARVSGAGVGDRVGSRRPEIVMICSSMGEYRQGALKIVVDRLGRRIAIFADSDSLDGTVRTIVDETLHIRELKNYVLPFGAYVQLPRPRSFLGPKTVILDLNPRGLHIWLILAARRLFGRRTLLWGHVHPRAGPAARTSHIRRLQRSLASGLIVYTAQERVDALEVHPNQPAFVAPNALYSRSELHFEANRPRTTVLYVGRLVAEKEVELLLEAFLAAVAQRPGIRLAIAGDGPLRDQLRHMPLGEFENNVRLLGHISEYEQLKLLYAQAFVSVSPGYAGLSLIQSLGFGVPMLINRTSNHAPEISAAVEGRNSTYFDGSVTGLTNGLVTMYDLRDEWERRGHRIAESCRSEHSVEAMADGLLRASCSK